MTDAPHIETARARLRALIADTETAQAREDRRLTAREHEAACTIMSELHRLHVAVSGHREIIERLQDELNTTNQQRRKPPAARSTGATTRNTTRKHGVHE